MLEYKRSNAVACSPRLRLIFFCIMGKRCLRQLFRHRGFPERCPRGFPREDSQQVPADSSTFQQVAASAAGSAGTSRFLKVPQVPAGSAGTSRTQQFPAMLSRIERVAARSSKSQQNAESAAHSSRSQQVPAIPAGRSRFQQVQIYSADSCIRFAEKPRPEG